MLIQLRITDVTDDDDDDDDDVGDDDDDNILTCWLRSFALIFVEHHGAEQVFNQSRKFDSNEILKNLLKI